MADPQPDGPRFSVVVGPDFNTCYYSGSLRASGSDAIKRDATVEVETPLEASVVVTNAAEIETVMTQPEPDVNIVISATALLPDTNVTGMPALTAATAVTPTFFVPAGDVVNVRSSPTTRARAIGRLQGPFDGNILGRSVDGLWLQFEVPRNKRMGWINSDVVTVKGYFEERPPVADVPATPVTATVPVAELPRVIVPRGDLVNVRNGPGTVFDILGRMRSRQTAFITGKTDDGSLWQITYGQNQAWISAEVVRTVGNLISVPTVSSPPQSGRTP